MKKFIDIHIPVTACNLDCHYCYVTLGKARNTKATPFMYDAYTIGKALSQERLGGICHFNMCGLGETLIPREIVEITKSLLMQGHYIMIVTNGTLTNRFEELMQFPLSLRKRLGFKFSFHYLELKNKNLLEVFYSNINLVKNAGCSFSVEMTPCDELEPYIEEIKKDCLEHFGALCHITIPRDVTKPGYRLQSRHSLDEFVEIWKTFDSEMFNFKLSTWEKKRNEYCYAGMWSGLLNIGNGELTACYGSRIVQNIFQDIEQPIEWIAVGKRCRLDHCYNGHSLLALGTIPEINSCKYCDERDRINKNDGTHWLNEEMKEFLSHKLEDYNRKLSPTDRIINSIRQFNYDIKRVKLKIEKVL